jgi:hypothetical protein
MRHALISLTIVLCATLLGCVSEKKNKLEGTWRLVTGTQKQGDTSSTYSQATYFGIKMFCENHVAWFGQHLLGGDTSSYYGGGTYTLEGNNYTESIEYNTYKSVIGRVIPFEVELKNDTLIQKGPRKIGKYQDSKWELYEVWVRMK